MARPDYNWKLPREIAERLGAESYGAQRAIFEKGYLLVVLHEPPSGEGNERVHRVFLRKPEGAWLYQGNEHGQRALLDLLDQYDILLETLEKRYRQAHTADELFQLIDRLMPVARAGTNLKDALQSARGHIDGEALLITARDRAVEVARGLELLLANARLALDYRLARHAEEQTQAAMAGTQAQLKLNTLAALTFPLMTLAAVFGMNLPSGLEAAPAWVFWGVFAAGLVVGFVVKGWVRSLPPPAPSKAPLHKSPANAKAGKK
jgi:Mg2+ and Co2+ transporter CorA